VYNRYLDLSNPVSNHWLNRGRVVWLYGVPRWSGGGTLFDLCRRANGVLTNGPTWVPTPYGAGVLFAGSTQYVGTGRTLTSLGVGETGSVAFWGYPTGDNQVAAAEGGLSVSGDATGVGRVGGGFWFRRNYFGGQPTVSGGTWALNTWRRVVATWSPGFMALYADGALIGTSSPALGAYTDGSPVLGFELGLRGDATTNSWLGRVADVSIWSRCLSVGDIDDDYDQSLRGYPNTLRWYARRPYLFLNVGGGGTPIGPVFGSRVFSGVFNGGAVQ
jgi:hypothetical protein